MKSIFLIIATLSTLFSAAQIEDNLELKKISADFERDHSSRRIDWDMVKKRDSIRQVRVIEILDATQSPSSNDYANAASVFGQCRDSISEVKVIELMTKAVELGPDRDRSLLAYGVDSQLIRQGELQVYGTHSYISLFEETYGQIVMFDVDTTQVTDLQRKAFGLRTLAEQREFNKSRSEKLLNDMFDGGKGVSEIVEFCKGEFQEDRSSVYTTERELYKFAIHVKRSDRLEEALKVYELIAEFYPDSFNAFDMLGDCHFELEQYESGIMAYERSLDLNPHKEYARKRIEEHKN